MTRRVTNSSPIIFLAKLERFDLLRLNVDEVLAPPAVLREVAVKPDVTAAVAAAIKQGWLLQAVSPPAELLALLPNLGAGESEAIATAMEKNAQSLLLDDLAARRVAYRFDVKPVGTIGLLLTAKKQGHIPSLSSDIARLKTLGFRISPHLERHALGEAGEL